jgi:hypothetical protein
MKHPKQKIDCGRISELKPILEKWCSLNRLYLKETQNDCPWWYNERASISILAAAAWKSGHIALEEFSTEKRQSRRDLKGPGRCDLKVRIGTKDFLFEAKQSRLRLSNKPTDGDLKETRRLIFNSLRKACVAAGRLRSGAGRRFGICFVSPRISEAEAGYLDKRLDTLIDLLGEKRKRYHSISWFFATNWEGLRNKGRIHPGVILLIREVHKFQKPKKRQAIKGR